MIYDFLFSLALFASFASGPTSSTSAAKETARGLMGRGRGTDDADDTKDSEGAIAEARGAARSADTGLLVLIRAEALAPARPSRFQGTFRFSGNASYPYRALGSYGAANSKDKQQTANIKESEGKGRGSG